MLEELIQGMSQALTACVAGFPRAVPFPWITGEYLFGEPFTQVALESLRTIPWCRVTNDFYSQEESPLHRIPEESRPAPLAEAL